MKGSPFTALSDDVVLKILFNLEDDPRSWARLACVSTKFSTLIRSICWRSHCLSIIPAVSADLSLPSSSGEHPPGGWSALHKISVCCPGLFHAGVLLDNSDFGLERELGPDKIYNTYDDPAVPAVGNDNIITSSSTDQNGSKNDCASHQEAAGGSAVAAVESGSSDLHWSLYDDLYFDTVYDNSESHDYNPVPNEDAEDEAMNESPVVGDRNCPVEAEESPGASKRRKIWRSMRSHLASGGWSLSREQGNKLLASRFREDSLYICDWPGCIHMEEKRNYMLFRGIFKNFKRSRVWRTINDGQRSKIDIHCAYCSCKKTWDLHSAFCLRRVFGYHDDGEPVVRAYVCENGHVSGAWTDLPLYT
ncbi:hypothetical protein V2J09_002215 [Rumex salicifolius]